MDFSKAFTRLRDLIQVWSEKESQVVGSGTNATGEKCLEESCRILAQFTSNPQKNVIKNEQLKILVYIASNSHKMVKGFSVCTFLEHIIDFVKIYFHGQQTFKAPDASSDLSDNIRKLAFYVLQSLSHALAYESKQNQSNILLKEEELYILYNIISVCFDNVYFDSLLASLTTPATQKPFVDFLLDSLTTFVFKIESKSFSSKLYLNLMSQLSKSKFPHEKIFENLMRYVQVAIHIKASPKFQSRNYSIVKEGLCHYISEYLKTSQKLEGDNPLFVHLTLCLLDLYETNIDINSQKDLSLALMCENLLILSPEPSFSRATLHLISSEQPFDVIQELKLLCASNRDQVEFGIQFDLISRIPLLFSQTLANSNNPNDVYIFSEVVQDLLKTVKLQMIRTLSSNLDLKSNTQFRRTLGSIIKNYYKFATYMNAQVTKFKKESVLNANELSVFQSLYCIIMSGVIDMVCYKPLWEYTSLVNITSIFKLASNYFGSIPFDTFKDISVDVFILTFQSFTSLLNYQREYKMQVNDNEKDLFRCVISSSYNLIKSICNSVVVRESMSDVINRFSNDTSSELIVLMSRLCDTCENLYITEVDTQRKQEIYHQFVSFINLQSYVLCKQTRVSLKDIQDNVTGKIVIASCACDSQCAELRNLLASNIISPYDNFAVESRFRDSNLSFSRPSLLFSFHEKVMNMKEFLRVNGFTPNILSYGSEEVSFYNNLKEALTLLVSSKRILNPTNLENGLINFSLVTVEDVKFLYHSLELIGHFEDQCLLVSCLKTILGEIETEYKSMIETSLGFKMCYDRISDTVEDVMLRLTIQAISMNYMKCTLQSSIHDIFEQILTEYSFKNKHFKAIADHCKALHTFLIEEGNRSTDVSAIENLEKEINEIDKDYATRAFLKSWHIPHNKLDEHEMSNSSLLSLIVGLHAKVHLYVLGNHDTALRWAKRSYQVCAQNQKENNANDYKCLFLLLSKLESIILLMDINEQIGHLDVALSYATSVRTISNQYPMSIVGSIGDLHLLRLWHRLESKKLKDFCNDILSKVSKHQGKQHLEQSGLSFMHYQLCSLIIANLKISNNQPTIKISKDNSLLFLRYSHKTWDINSLTSTSNKLPNVFHIHSNMSCTAKVLVKKAYANYRPDENNSFILSTGTNSANMLVNLPELEYVINQRLRNFEVVRNIRRISCSKLMASIDRDSTSATSELVRQCFVLGASSCLTSLETTVTDGENMNQNFATPYMKLSESSNLIQSSCVGNSQSLIAIFKHLSNLSNSKSDSVFITIEPCKTKLLLGRHFSSSGSTIMIDLFIGQELSEVLEEWDMIIKENDRLLNTTSDANTAGKLSENDKKKWWIERKENNKATQEFLLRLQAMMRGWTWLLSTKCCCVSENINTDHRSTESSDIIDNVSLDLSNLTFESKVEKNRTSKPKMKKTSNSILNSEILDESLLNEIGMKINPWIKVMTDHGAEEQNISQCLTDIIVANYPNITSVNRYVENIVEQYKCSQRSIASSNETDMQHLRDEYEAMKVADIRQLLKKKGESAFGKKDGLITRLLSLSTSSNENTKEQYQSEQASHVVLILDESLQSLPWESLPCLQFSSITRMPSLTVLLSTLIASQENGLQNTIRLEKSWYLIDPEGNLPASRETLQSYLKPYIQRWSWPGYTAEIKSADILRSHHINSDLFIYCGHGSGDIFIDSTKLKKKHIPSALLWGCSSGKLTANGIHDPSGAALNYLLGGAKVVVGNLWDVTDKDLDKYSLKFMNLSLFNSESEQFSKNGLTEALNQSRNACKLQYIVGSAPIMYGIPSSIN